MQPYHTARVASTLLALIPSITLAGSYSLGTGTTPGAPDNPIAKNTITKFESSIYSYAPTPGVTASYNPATGFGPLGDLYSPVERPVGTPAGFNSLYQPAAGTKPPFHSGGNYSGNLNDTADSFGFIGIDQPGAITLRFDTYIYDGAGADFAVFENGIAHFSNTAWVSIDLAFVEVSSNGVDFIRFNSISTNSGFSSGSAGYAYYDVTNIYNLAGKHASGWGTPFDLGELAGHNLVLDGIVNLNEISYIRLVDVVGSGELRDADGNVISGIARDSQGNAILDNWVTYASGGFDYLGLNSGSVGAINYIPETGSAALTIMAALAAGARRRRNH